MSGEWIEHAGKRRPVHRDERVEVRFRSGREFSGTADTFHWVDMGHASDIIAYRLPPKPNQKQKEAE